MRQEKAETLVDYRCDPEAALALLLDAQKVSKQPATSMHLARTRKMDSRTQADHEAVRQAVLDYVEGVYEANPDRVARCVHPDLAKRGFFVTANDTTESIMTFAQLLDLARNYRQDNQDAPKEVILFEVLDQTASVKLIAAWGIDYMHLAKYNGQWLIVHVLWQTQPNQ